MTDHNDRRQTSKNKSDSVILVVQGQKMAYGEVISVIIENLDVLLD